MCANSSHISREAVATSRNPIVGLFDGRSVGYSVDPSVAFPRRRNFVWGLLLFTSTTVGNFWLMLHASSVRLHQQSFQSSFPLEKYPYPNNATNGLLPRRIEKNPLGYVVFVALLCLVLSEGIIKVDT